MDKPVEVVDNQEPWPGGVKLRWRFIHFPQDLDLVAHPDRAGLNYPRADATPTLEGSRHARFGEAPDVPADGARPPVLERRLPDAEPLPASQGLQARSPGDDVAPVLAVLHAYAGLAFDGVEVLGRDEGVTSQTLPKRLQCPVPAQ